MASLRTKTSAEVRGADMEVIEMGTANMVDTTAGEPKWVCGGERMGEGSDCGSRARGSCQSSRACAGLPPQCH